MPRLPEQLPLQMRVSRAFVRLCLDAGCPTRNGLLSAAELMSWLFDHFEEVRALAGLPPVPSVEDLTIEATQRLRLANALFTLLEYSRSRATCWKKKRQFRLALETVERSLDRA
jgi:hypothetical protein